MVLSDPVKNSKKITNYHCSQFTHHFSLFTYHSSLFTFHSSLFTFHLSLITLPLSLFTFHFSLFTFPVYAATTFISPAKVSVSASIPENSITIFGYTAPKSKVELTNPQVSATTISLDDGYFEFDHIILPKPLTDLCLSSLDASQNSTPLTCIPPPPITQFYTSIGPIILAPTINLSHATINAHQTVTITGQAIPNANLSLSFYQQDSNPALIPLVKPANAMVIPKIPILSDSQGHYSINLPTTYATNYRFFATALFNQEYPSPKSNTLNAHLPSFWSLYYIYIIFFTLFIVSPAIFSYLTIRYFYIKKVRYLPAVYQKQLFFIHTS